MYSSLASVHKFGRSSSLLSLLARDNGNLDSSRLFSVMPNNNGPEKSDKPDIDILNVVSVLTQQRSKSRWGHLRSLCPNGFNPTEFSQIALQIKNNPHLALRFFLWTQKNSLCHHNLTSYSTIIHILARGRHRNRALIFINEAIRVSGSDDPESNSNPLRVFETLTKTYTRCGSAPFVFDLLIESCLQSKKIEHAITIVRMLLSRGISPRFSTCNSLIRQVSRSLGANKCHDLYKEIFLLENSVVRVRPSVEIFNTLMVAFYQEKDLERVRAIWSEMIELNCDPNSFSFSIVMAAYCDEGKTEKAEELWEIMRGKSVELDVMAYNTIIGGFCRTGDVEKAEEFFKEMESSGIESTRTTYEHLVKGYCQTGNIDSAMLVYRNMISRGFKAEGLAVDKLIRGLCEGNRVSEALKVLRSILGYSGLGLRRENFEVLIMALCRDGDVKEALKLQAEMVSKGFEPSSKIYGAFISGYEEQGNLEMAAKLRKEMSQIGLK